MRAAFFRSPMRVIGLLGGMSWESTATYYRLLNEEAARRLGGLHSAPILLASLDFDGIAALQREGRWEEAGGLLASAAAALETAGAELLVLATNTMHKVAGAIESAVSIPLLHIADPTAEEIRRHGIGTIGLLGTRYTMEEDFYRGRLEDRHGLSVVVPADDERALVHRVIYEELCLGRVEASSRQAYARVVDGLVAAGARGIVLGCTEIGLLLRQEDASVPLFDTTTLHARGAVETALAAAIGEVRGRAPARS